MLDETHQTLARMFDLALITAPQGIGLGTEASEDGLRSLRQLPCNLDNALAEGDPAPFGKLLLGLVTAGHADIVIPDYGATRIRPVRAAA